MNISRDVFLFLSHVIQKYGRIDLPAQGSSMFPFIRHGDICRFIPCKESELRIGDIVLYHAVSGKLVAHRLHHIHTLPGKSPQYSCKGDANLGVDQPFPYDRIIGKLLHVRKHKRDILITRSLMTSDVRMTRLSAAAWTHLVLKLPALSRLLRLYLDNREFRKKARKSKGAV